MRRNFKKKYSIWNALDLISWIVLLGSGYVMEFHYHLFVPSLYLIARGLGRRSAIKADLKNAVDYCRVKKSLPRLALEIALGIVVALSVAYGFIYLEPYLPERLYVDYGYFIFTGFIYTLLIARFQNFTKGIRWYVSGMKLPGERSLLIPWRHVSEVQAKGGSVHVKVFGEHYVFRIDSKDYRSAIHFERWFEKKKALENSTIPSK